MRKAFKVCLVALAAVLAAYPAFAEKRVPSSKTEMSLSFAPLVKQTAPAVVNIYTRKTVRTRAYSPLFNDPFFRRFFGPELGGVPGGTRKRVQNSLGSGVIVRSDGLVITNHHVIEGADDITVILADRREYEAKLVGSDDRTDLAVLQIDPEGRQLPFLDLKDSDGAEVGDLVLAIGNPFGVGQTVTSGIISAVARANTGISNINSFIQTDASINPGNSGGALVSMDGKLLGINTAIFSKGGGSNGIGFAIPANMVRSVVSGLANGDRLIRPWLGAEGQGVTHDLALSLGLDRPGGVLINRLYKDGPAERAGIRVGDVVLKVNGKVINDGHDMRYRVATLKLGSQAQLIVWRNDKRKKIFMGVSPPPENPKRHETILSGRHPFAGAKIANLSPALADELGMDMLEQGVIILGLKRGETAARLGFKPGDILVEVNGKPIRTVAKAKHVLKKGSRDWKISIRRNGKVLSQVFR
ncbi:MAG: DegQ family serine endoprotease [Alphaproteobacteria bacterium]|nr:DegQ family serine endoprotease [Rhodospirillales bacterium]MCW9045947.1 DegQ family serine endoprotease [Alphaproteobacteria bacterium]